MTAADASGAPSPLLSVRDLRVGFGSSAEFTQVVHGVSFTIARGECLAIVGESGSGKSVTARTVIGLPGDGATVQAAQLSFDGIDLLRVRERGWRSLRARRIGFILQDALVSLDPLREVGKEVEEVLAQHTSLSVAERRARVLELLTSVGIPDARRRARQIPQELSGGLRQRALIATGIAADPELIIADEPTTALDVTVQAQVLALLRGFVDAGRSLLLISHDLAVVSQIADRVLVVQAGRIVEQGAVSEVLRSPQHPYTRQLLQAVPSAASKGTRLSPEPPSSYGERTSGAAWTVRPRGSSGAVDAGGTGDAGDVDVVVSAQHVSKEFRSRSGESHVAVADASFALRRGETLGIVGESGSGKSTLARLVLGLDTPGEGRIEVGGRAWPELRGPALRAARLGIQAVYQDALSTFDPRHTVARILREALGASGVRSRRESLAQSVELLELVGLGREHLERRPLQLSGGQRQRVAIARALAPRPAVIVCDEPVSALDVSIQAQVLDLFADIQKTTGVAYLFISHDLGVIHHVADRVLVMKDGRIVEQGDAADVLHNPSDPYTRELLAAIPRLNSAAAAL
jgi:peptide/nickel transport system ATP-binding protein